jgi:hypothetical protein
MTHTRRCGRRAALLAASVAALLSTGIGYAQDDLGGAKTLYVNASYEEALGLLDTQAAAAGRTGARAAEVHHYRALCLIALGRTPEADQAIALSVAADPFSVPDTSELAPRVASVFTAARVRLVPDVARAALAEGRQLMQKGDATAANQRFEAVTRLLAEPGLAERADLADLTLAANALAELTRAQIAAAAAATTSPSAATVSAAPAASPVAAPAASPAANPPAGNAAPAPRPGAQPPSASRTPPVQPPPADQAVAPRPPTASPAAAGFVAAVPISQVLPPWTPPTGTLAHLGFTGAVRVLIDATGKVTGAMMEPSVYPPYDRLVLTAARNWTYQPATRNGEPVNSERLVQIVLRPRVSP